MADVTIDPQNKNPDELVTQGMTAYYMQNYSTAVQALSLASELLAAKHGDKHDSLGDVYYYYGKSLLELSREESEPLGDAVTKKLEDDSDSDEIETAEISSSSSGGKNEAGPSGEEAAANTTADQEGEQEEEEPSDLQVAWEVLELAKIIYENRGETGKKKLAETLVVLGEVSLESENFQAAVTDIKRGLEIMTETMQNNQRILAETHYKLGIALSTNSEMDDAIIQFNSSLDILKNRIKTLEEEDKEKNETEITQMKELIPEIEEKIADTKNFKEEVCIAIKKIVDCELIFRFV